MERAEKTGAVSMSPCRKESRMRIFIVYNNSGEIISVSKVEFMSEELEHPYVILGGGEAVMEIPAKGDILQLEALQIHEQFKVNVAKGKLVKRT
jgi:hypothetical protein